MSNSTAMQLVICRVSRWISPTVYVPSRQRTLSGRVTWAVMAATVGLPSSGNDCSRMGDSLPEEIARHIRALADWQDGPVTCPFLAATHSPYLVYDHCPAAYRIYMAFTCHVQTIGGVPIRNKE